MEKEVAFITISTMKKIPKNQDPNNQDAKLQAAKPQPRRRAKDAWLWNEVSDQEDREMRKVVDEI
jgi:hypothetical protein